MTEHKNPPIEMIAAIAKFETARASLVAFRNENSKLVETHDLLVAAYNDALKEAKTKYRSSVDDVGPKWGEFRAVTKTEIDARKLLELMPNAEGLVKIEYKVIKEEYDKAVEKELIPQKVQAQITSQGSVAIYGPKEL